MAFLKQYEGVSSFVVRSLNGAEKNCFSSARPHVSAFEVFVFNNSVIANTCSLSNGYTVAHNC